jgi:hypothetical protein
MTCVPYTQAHCRRCCAGTGRSPTRTLDGCWAECGAVVRAGVRSTVCAIASEAHATWPGSALALLLHSPNCRGHSRAHAAAVVTTPHPRRRDAAIARAAHRTGAPHTPCAPQPPCSTAPVRCRLAPGRNRPHRVATPGDAPAASGRRHSRSMCAPLPAACGSRPQSWHSSWPGTPRWLPHTPRCCEA